MFLQPIGALLAYCLLAHLLLTSLIMLFSPKAWLALPGWIGFQGSLTDTDTRGYQQTVVRLAGAAMAYGIGEMYLGAGPRLLGVVIGHGTWGELILFWIAVAGACSSSLFVLLARTRIETWIDRLDQPHRARKNTYVLSVRIAALLSLGISAYSGIRGAINNICG